MLAACCAAVTARAALSSFVIALAAVSVLVGGGCRQAAGIEDEPEFETRSCGVSFTPEACAACMGSSCCAPTAACAAAPECQPFTSCAFACPSGDIACATSCRARFPAGAGEAAASLESCKASSCREACQVSCGGYVYADAACGACGVAKCCDLATECMEDLECARLIACEHACAVDDRSCLGLCEIAHPDGVAHERAFGACLASSCAVSCIPPKWECLRHIVTARPPATAPAIRITYTFRDYETSRALVGLSVRACLGTDLQCTQPIVAPVVTDGNGQATLQFGGNLFDGYAEVTGLGYGPVLLYFPPLSKDFVTRPMPIPSTFTLAKLSAAIVPAQPDRGRMVVQLLDCSGEPAPGARVALDPSEGSTGFYFSERIPSLAATETDAFGAVAGFANVKADTALTLRTTIVENGLTYAPVVVAARPGAGLTFVQMYAAGATGL
jgi:hypothetical protein